MSRAGFCFYFLAFFLAAVAAWAEVPGGENDDFEPLRGPVPELPQPRLPQGALSFDPEVVDGLLLEPHIRNFIGARPEDTTAPQAGRGDRFERDFAVFIEIFKFFNQYVNEFQEARDKYYSNVGDFRAYYVHALPKWFPQLQNMSFQVETYRTTVDNDNIMVRTTGGGAGLRIDLHPLEGGTFTATLMPIYGEKRDFDTSATHLQGGTDYILRASAAVGYQQKLLGGRVEPGFQVFFQPQIIDFRQFRVYAETFIKLRVLRDDTKVGQYLRIEEVSLVPKLVFWQSTDRGGVLGDPVAALLGSSYARLDKNLYALMNLEFHFGM